METLEQLRGIVKNAPDGAQAVMMVCNPIYTKLENNFWYAACSGQEWVQVADKQVGIMRSLSDIKLIIELMELNQNMHTTVAGYLWGKDWAHWNEFNAGKFKL